MKTSILIFAIMTLIGCSSGDNKYYNGEIKTILDNRVIRKRVISNSVTTQGTPTGIIATHDSLLICWNPSNTSNFFNVLNINSGEDYGGFCPKGKGDNESISLGCIFQLFEKDGDLKSMLYAFNEKSLFEWNISKSIKHHRTIYDRVIPYSNYRVFSQFYISNDTMVIYKPSDSESQKGVVTPPFYEKRTINSNELVQSYNLYNVKSVRSSNNDDILYAWNAIKPDGSKVVQATRYLPQISIIDINTGDIVNYRAQNGYNLSYLETNSRSANIYYNCIHADNEYIYATYWGKEPWIDSFGATPPLFNTIHIFNWEGELLYELTTDRSYFRIWKDLAKNRLYTIDINSDDIYYLDLDDILR